MFISLRINFVLSISRQRKNSTGVLSTAHQAPMQDGPPMRQNAAGPVVSDVLYNHDEASISSNISASHTVP